MGLDDILIADIAHGLANECRFKAQCPKFFSVAQHSVMVADRLGDRLALAGLLHDAAEAYIRDIPAPVKHLWWMWPYRKAEARLEQLIFTKFGLRLTKSDLIKIHAADRAQYVNESKMFTDPTAVEFWPPEEAEVIFTFEFERLYPWTLLVVNSALGFEKRLQI